MKLNKQKARRFGIRLIKIIGWITISIVVLITALSLVIQIPAIQQRLIQKAVTFVHRKIGTAVSVGRISILFPKRVVLEKVFLEDQFSDTLLFAGRLSVNTDLWSLTQNRIELNSVELEDFTTNVHRSADSVFNFDYIVKAFASDTTQQTDTTAAGWDFELHDVDLHRINISYQDSVEGNSLALQLGTLDVEVDEFDLRQSVIRIDEIHLADVDAQVIQTRPPVVETTMVATDTTSYSFDIDVGEVKLENIMAGYEQQATGQQITLNLGRLLLIADKIDLLAKRINLSEFLLEETFLTYHQLPTNYKSAPVAGDSAARQSAQKEGGWQFTLGDMLLSNNSFQYYDFNKPVLPGAVDFNHLWISDMNTQMENIAFSESDITATLVELSAAEKSGFAIRLMKGTISVTEQSADLSDFIVQTSNSELHVTLHSNFTSLANLAESYENATIEASIRDTRFAWKDALYFQPALEDSLPLTIPSDAVLTINMDVRGKVNDLQADQIALTLLDDTRLATHGRVRGLPDIDHARFDVALDTFYTTASDMATIIPAAMLPPAIQLPEWVRIHGDFRGTLRKPSVRSAMNSSLGAIHLKATMDLDSLSETQGYNATLAVDQLEVGRLLGQPDAIGPLTMEASVEGTGTSIGHLTASINATVHSFVYLKYPYRNFHIEGMVNKYLFSGKASMRDPNLDFNLETDLDYNGDIPAYKLILELRNVDLHKLNLVQTPLQAKGTLKADFKNADLRRLNGSLDLRDVLVYNGKLYRVDSLLFASINQEGNTEVDINSDIVEGKFKGTIDISSLPEVAQQHFHSYYTLHDTIRDKSMQSQNFKFNLQLKNTDLLTEVLMPQLRSFVPGEIRGEFNSDKRELDIYVNVKKIHYTSVSAQNLTFTMTSDNKNLEYDFSTDNIDVGVIHIPSLTFGGDVSADQINTSLVILDSLEKEKYIIGGMFQSLEEGYRFYFDPEQVILNYEPWQVPEGNYIQFGKGVFKTNQLELKHSEETISISTPGDKDSTVAIAFRKLDLKSLTSMVASNDTLLDGMLHGDIKIFKARQSGAMEAQIGIKDFAIQQKQWGNLNLSIGQTSANGYSLDFTLKGPGNDFRLQGNYLPEETDAALNMEADIISIDLASIEPLTFGRLKDLKGALTGNFSLKGSIDKPALRGDLRFRNAEFFATYLKTKLLLKDEIISFTDAGIEIRDLEILDNKNNPVQIAGSINTKTYKKFAFDLNIRAREFQLMNTTAEDNKLFYGNVRLNTQATIRGTSDLPVINMRVSLGDDSEFTYVVPEPESGVMEHEGIVKFVDKDAHQDPFLASLLKEGVVTDTAVVFTGMDLTANIELNDRETFNIVMDPMTGDQLSVRGNTNLTLNINPTGDMLLSGRYELTEGTYNLTFYKLVKRELAIEQGSTITWTGDPMDAMLDIRATYRVETSPLDLVSNQLTGSDQSLINQYKQRLPFIVHLFIAGKILTPEITFELDMPELERGALEGVPYARIKDINTRESELNKQVFALLILRRFISDNPFENQAAEGFEATARRSVSKIMSDQLNKLSQNIEGVELNFDFKSYEDYSSGQAENTTQLQLGLTKNFLNERLIVKLSGNVNLEGEQTEQNTVTDYIGDLVLEYKLTEDGRFRITGFRRSDYSMIDGQLIETGAGIIYVKDYNAFRELFKSNVRK